MVIDPITLAVIAGGLNLGVKAIGSYKKRKEDKKNLKEKKKSLRDAMISNNLDQAVENENKRLQSSRHLSKRRSDAFKNTAASVRSALL